MFLNIINGMISTLATELVPNRCETSARFMSYLMRPSMPDNDVQLNIIKNEWQGSYKVIRQRRSLG